jgi:hypothetical protein
MVILALLIYTALPGIFPWTKGFAATLLAIYTKSSKKMGLGFGITSLI